MIAASLDAGHSSTRSRSEASEIQRVEALIKPSRLESVKEAILGLGVQGMTIVEVRGFGRQKGHLELYQGAEYAVDFVPKVKVEVAVDAAMADVVVEAIREAAATGRIGDGKIFVMPVDRVLRIRTGESGSDAL